MKMTCSKIATVVHHPHRILVGLHTITVNMGYTTPVDGYGTCTGVTSTMVKPITVDGVGWACTTHQLTAIYGCIYGSVN